MLFGLIERHSSITLVALCYTHDLETLHYLLYHMFQLSLLVVQCTMHTQ